jgi:hypothetical protein
VAENRGVRFAPKSCRGYRQLAWQLRANSDISHCGKLATINGQSAHPRRGVSYRGKHCQAAERAAADIEGHSTAAKFSQPGRLNEHRRTASR